MSVRPNGLGASRVGHLHERDEATAARHRGFLDLDHEDDALRRRVQLERVTPAPVLARLDPEEVVAVSLRAVTPELDDDDMEPITKWPLVVGTLVVAILLLVGFAAMGALPFR
jgi:hypothetical protein